MNTLSQLSHNALIERMAEKPGNETLWREFLHRFSKFIAAVILRECNRLSYSQGNVQINDLLQEVYIKLLNKEGKALKSFRGRHQNSIIKYLSLIAINVVRTDFQKNILRKRKQDMEFVSLSEKDSDNEKRKSDSGELIYDPDWETENRHNEMVEEIELCLRDITKRSRTPERDTLIFRYHFYYGFQANEIAALPEFDISEKRIGNLISTIKDNLRGELGSAKLAA